MNRTSMLLGSVFGFAAVCAAYGLGVSHGSTAAPARSFDGRAVVLAALTPEEAAACERERQALYARLNQCTTDQCRQDVQREIDAHNARCQ